jgi:MerR family transcriptional regulator/heat shock protein HspR
MNPSRHDPGDDHGYSLDVVAEITGISSQTIVRYQEVGLIRSDCLDDEDLRKLRRIDYLQDTCEANLAGIKLILDLLEKVEQLQSELRTKH